MNLIFHTPNGWRWNKFPEKPDRCHHCDGIEHRVYFLCEKCKDEYDAATKAYERQVAELMASALEVANPKLADEKLDSLQWVVLVNETDLYHWLGEVSFEKILHCDEYHSHTKSSCYVTKAVLHLPKEKTEPKEQEVKEEHFQPKLEYGNNMSDEELITKCNEWVSSLAKSGGKSWVLSVPVRFDKDPDMLFITLGERLKNSRSDNEALRQSVRELIPIAERMYSIQEYHAGKGNHEAEHIESAIDRAKQHVGKPE